MSIKKTVRKHTPSALLSLYHFALALLAAAWYSFPSRKLFVIGVTGTKGKTSTANFIWSVLEESGEKTGLISTANIRISEKEWMNTYHMTMPGPFVLEGLLRRMVDEGCTACIVETTSEGINQWRHMGIAYDAAIFTNLSPEHLPSHGGSFENYKAAKGKLFERLARLPEKTIGGKAIPKIIVANADSPHGTYFLSLPADKKISFGLKEGVQIRATSIETGARRTRFELSGSHYELSVPGAFNVMNALPAIAIGIERGIPPSTIAAGLKKLALIPGRMEEINTGQAFTVIVDYAHEKESMTAALEAAAHYRTSGGKIIVLLGAEGGGRDKNKRPIMGEIAAEQADIVIVSNVDPYDDDPLPIIEDIARAAETNGKKRDQTLFAIEDRRLGIRKALELAERGDVVLITGKGAEQSMVLGGKTIPWDDRAVVREELKKIMTASPRA